MTSINFYVSKQEGLEHRLVIVHKLVCLARQRNLAVYIHTDNESSSQQVDNFLWSHDKTSFIPHAVIDNTKMASADSEISDTEHDKGLVRIAHNYEPFKNCDYLINLTNSRPEFFSRFLKVAEILDNSEEIIAAGRKRYAFYRDRGYTLQYHQL